MAHLQLEPSPQLPATSGRSRPFRVKPITGALGAELLDIDISQDLDDETISAIRQAMLDRVRALHSDRRVAGPARDLGASNAKKAKSDDEAVKERMKWKRGLVGSER